MTGWWVTIIATTVRCIPILPSPIYVSLQVGPKPFEGFVHLPSHPQLIDLYRRVTVFRHVVLYPECCRLLGHFWLSNLQLAGGRWRGGTDLEAHDPCGSEFQNAGHFSSPTELSMFENQNSGLFREKQYSSLRK